MAVSFESIARAIQRSEFVLEELRSQAYNCECQVGGVDAMSIDTDWIIHNVNQVIKLLTTGEEEEEVDYPESFSVG